MLLLGFVLFCEALIVLHRDANELDSMQILVDPNPAHLFFIYIYIYLNPIIIGRIFENMIVFVSVKFIENWINNRIYLNIINGYRIYNWISN